MEQALNNGVLVDAAVAKGIREAEEFWAIRDASGELEQLFGEAVNFDISVPIGDVSRFVGDCRASIQHALPGASMLVFGHIADSNIHLSCKAASGSPPVQLIEKVVYECVRPG
jgi:FAD/FMN-containing dehydrogenase